MLIVLYVKLLAIVFLSVAKEVNFCKDKQELFILEGRSAQPVKS